MDYRNADGSIAEMCGNGSGLLHVLRGVPGRAELVRGGRARRHPRRGAPGRRHEPTAATVSTWGRPAGSAGGRRSWAATPSAASRCRRGNPHLACVTDVPDALDLTCRPAFDPVRFPHGVNVEFVNVLEPARLRMRVHERGVGETRSCGTGACAAAYAALADAGPHRGHRRVDVPGGRLAVRIDPRTTVLTGPRCWSRPGRCPGVAGRLTVRGSRGSSARVSGSSVGASGLSPGPTLPVPRGRPLPVSWSAPPKRLRGGSRPAGSRPGSSSSSPCPTALDPLSLMAAPRGGDG